MGEWGRDLKYSVRLLAKAPAFTTVAVLSLALGIGVTSAVLGAAQAVLYRPLPVPQPEQLALVHWAAEDVKGAMMINSGTIQDPASGRTFQSNYTHAGYLALRQALEGSAEVFAYTFLREAHVSAGDRPMMMPGMLVSGSYFRGLGVPMSIGRGLVEADDAPGAEPAVVISHRLWRQAFGADPNALGRTLRVNGHAFTVVGVTDPPYFGVSNGGFFPPADISLPLAAQPMVSPGWTPRGQSLFTSDRTLWLRVMARLHPGQDPAVVQRMARETFTAHVASEGGSVFAEARNLEVALLPGARGLDSMRATLERPIYMLGGVALMVFLIACVNLASLVLARGLARQQEFRVRLALGAGRMRLVRQTLIDSLLLATFGGALGLVVASWGGPALIGAIAGPRPHALDVPFNLELVTLCAGMSFVAALLSGLFPAFRLSSQASDSLLRQSGAAAPRLRAGRVLLAVQVAVSVPLLVGSLLFLRTLHNLSNVDLGFDAGNVMVFRMDPGLSGYNQADARALYPRVLDRLRAEPGVQSASLVENSLVSGWISTNRLLVEGGEPRNIQLNRVGPGFFETMGLPLVAGRGFARHDDAGARPVAVINESAAARLFPGESPLGRTLTLEFPKPTEVEIVGVAGDSRYSSLRTPGGSILFLPYLQSTGLTAMFVVVRTMPSPGMAERLSAAVAEVSPDIPPSGLQSLTRQIDQTVANERALGGLLTFFGLFAVGLAALGLHGVTSYSVSRRTGEIGIRMALGARPGHVLWLILRQVVVLAVAGLLVGLPAATWLSRTAESLLFEVTPADPLSLIVATVALLATALLAGFIPAWRAARLDPSRALNAGG